jgi:hypothetical protein
MSLSAAGQTIQIGKPGYSAEFTCDQFSLVVAAASDSTGGRRNRYQICLSWPEAPSHPVCDDFAGSFRAVKFEPPDKFFGLTRSGG